MASAAFNEWAASVKAGGGRVTVDPWNRKTDARGIPAAAYPAPAWVPRVNGKTWPLPDDYSLNGYTAYYFAPIALRTEISSFPTASDGEVEIGGRQVMSGWGTPEWLQSLTGLEHEAMLLGGLVLAAWLAVKWMESRKR